VTTIVWLRHDLRLKDNPALYEARDGKVIPIYIKDESIGSVSNWWAEEALKKLPFKIFKYQGDPLEIILNLVKVNKANRVVWNRCYEPHRIIQEKKLSELLDSAEINHSSFNASLLWEPWTVLKEDKTYYKVFTPFYRKGCLSKEQPRAPLPEAKLNFVASELEENYQPLKPEKWHSKLKWDPSEEGAHKTLKEFLEVGIHNYKEGRNFPAEPYVSRLSPYLHLGHISPNQLWYSAKASGAGEKDIDHFLSELGWREFSYYLMYHFPGLPEKNFQPKFDSFPWTYDEDKFKSWKKGMTGVPIVDAGMRQLWQTGYIHNRVRMIVASFLVKNLLIHWHYGRDWFWDCLVDADLANNSASWQWVAGSGADAAPYFRIFNPILQAEKFDPEGKYIRKFVPEIANLPNKYIFAPWEAPEEVLSAAGINLGTSYPRPIVDLDQSREAALKAYTKLKEAS
jgi:deoxyribodipyrimidine photo-lyase